jgi:NADH dehydrogenase
LTFVAADVTKPSTLPTAVEGVDVIVQAAQFPNAPNEDPAKGLTYMEVDRNGTMNLLEATAQIFGARTAGPGMTRFPEGAPRFVYLSGVTVCEAATNSWDRAKWQAEEAIRGSGLDWTIVRSSWSYGPEDASLNRILGYSDILPFVPIFGDGEERLTPVFVEDVGRLFARVVAEPAAAEAATLPLGGPDVLTMNEVLQTALAVMNRRRPILHIPKPVGRLQGAMMQFLPGRPLTPMAVDFTSQGGVADPGPLGERFPDFQTTRLRAALEGYLAPAVRPT